ncbi:MAG: hypothetical protein HY842_02825 [Bacteroidetes bacterium]|nr:hypothetical protein [Bacteroidota bacterium]
MEDKLLAFAVAMFVLSQISERISNFIKLYLPKTGIEVFNNLDVHSEDEEMEKKRERIIFLISIVAGMLTTSLFWNFLSYIPKAVTEKSHIEFPLQWMLKYKDWGLFLAISFFLSFGAKFWHDILDIIYFYKNAKRNLQDPEFYKLGSVEEVEERLKQTPTEIALLAFNFNKDNILKREGVVAFSRGFEADGTPCFRVRFKDRSSAAKFENEVLWVDGRGFEHRIKVEKLVTGPVKAQSAQIGGKIFNAATPWRTGTAGYVFKDKFMKKQYILSCYHVMKAEHSWQSFRRRSMEDIKYAIDDNQSQSIATLFFGYRNELLDVAIAQINSLDLIDMDSLPRVAWTAYVNKNYIGIRVKIKGMSSGLVDAIIHEPYVDVNVEYEDNSNQFFNDFFSLSLPDELKCPTVGGDSGALVYRENGEALGIIVGGSDSLAYAMKIPVIEDSLGIEIVPVS